MHILFNNIKIVIRPFFKKVKISKSFSETDDGITFQKAYANFAF